MTPEEIDRIMREDNGAATRAVKLLQDEDRKDYVDLWSRHLAQASQSPDSQPHPVGPAASDLSPPAFLGGQGRDSEEIRCDGIALGWLLLLTLGPWGVAALLYWLVIT